MPQVKHPQVRTQEALAIYRELGELTDKEMNDLYHSYSRVGRENYFRNIYGYSAGQIARQVYETWAGTHERCKRCPSMSTV